MHTSSVRFIFITALLLLATLTGCGDDGSEEGSDGSSTGILGGGLMCGPNGFLHESPGEEPHCHCLAGFTMVDGDCVPEETSTDTGGQGGGTDTPAETSRALPLTCWIPPNSWCDPRDGEGCDVAAGETCDLALDATDNLNIVCLPGPNPQREGESCDPSAGPFCSAGLHCVEAVCKRYCCDDSSCSGGTSCQPFAAEVGTLGVCNTEAIMDPDEPDEPICAGPGEWCQRPSECCSNDCHAGHCH